MKPEDLQKLNEVYDFMQSLKSANTIPLEIDRSFKSRFSQNLGINASSKSASSENQHVDESGSSGYNVLKSPDGFDQRVDNGVTKHYPYFL